MREQRNSRVKPVPRTAQELLQMATANAVRTRKHGHYSKRRQARQTPHIFGIFYRVIEIFANESQSYTADQPYYDRQKYVARFVRPRRRRRYQRWIHHTDIART